MGDKRNILMGQSDGVSYETSPGVEVLVNFDSMGLRQDLMRGIYAYGTGLVILCVAL